MILGEDGKWYELSDQFTRALPALTSPPPNAYILFYIRQDVKDVDYRTLFNTYEEHWNQFLLLGMGVVRNRHQPRMKFHQMCHPVLMRTKVKEKRKNVP